MAMFHGLMIFSAFFLDKVHLISMVPRASGPYGLKPQSGVCRELIWFISPITVVSMGFITIVYIEKVFFNQLNQQWGAAPAAPINNTSNPNGCFTGPPVIFVLRRSNVRGYTYSAPPVRSMAMYNDASAGWRIDRTSFVSWKKCGLTSYRTSYLNN